MILVVVIKASKRNGGTGDLVMKGDIWFVSSCGLVLVFVVVVVVVVVVLRLAETAGCWLLLLSFWWVDGCGRLHSSVGLLVCVALCSHYYYRTAGGVRVHEWGVVGLMSSVCVCVCCLFFWLPFGSGFFEFPSKLGMSVLTVRTFFGKSTTFLVDNVVQYCSSTNEERVVHDRAIVP